MNTEQLMKLADSYADCALRVATGQTNHPELIAVQAKAALQAAIEQLVQERDEAQKLAPALTNANKVIDTPTAPAQQPLTDEQIVKMRHLIDWTAYWSYGKFARAIEAAHGIKGVK